MLRQFPRLSLFALAGGGLACVGSIADRDPALAGGDGPAPPPAMGEPPSFPGGASPALAADPGRVTIRRLNRNEYNNTVRDLLDSSLRPADAFARDPSAIGFDNNGDVQALTSSQVEQYEGAAFALVDELFGGGDAAGIAKLARAGRTSACDVADGGCRTTLVRAFARRAWRRPVAGDELDRLLGIAAAAQQAGISDPAAQLRLVIVGALVSPHFLFRPEADANPGAPVARALTDHELASRLSYLFWSSMPDDVLFAAADQGKLRSDDDVRVHIGRLLGDARAAAFIESFAGQWLDLRELEGHEVDPELFPEFSPELARTMKADTLGFFAAQLDGATGDPPVQALLGERGGLLTQRSVLTATSAPNGTNPVARGNWVLTKLLCTPPPPPPPDVPPAPEGVAAGKTMRERFEAHRVNPTCAACHQIMDPIGFALEHYDAIGRYRTQDGGVAIDARGELPGGITFEGAGELAAVIARDPRFPACLASHLFTYALGRAPADSAPDAAHLGRMTTLAARQPGGLTLRNLLLALGTSEAFRMRQGETP